MIKYYLLLIFMTVLGSFGAFFLKKASSHDEAKINIVKRSELYIGAFLYFLSALINVYILRFFDYTVVLPLTSLSYIWTMFIAKVLFDEVISKNKIIGVGCIIIGAVLIGVG